MNQTPPSKSLIWSGALLIAGTCIGAGMLALPLTTGVAGLFPALLINVVCWLIMLSTGLLFMEATLWMPDGANVISMAERFLGRPGKWFGGLSFIFLYYCLMTAYMAEGVPLFRDLLSFLFVWKPPVALSSLLFGGLFLAIVAMGTRFIDRINWILMASLCLSFLLLLPVGFSKVEPEKFGESSYLLSILALPTLFSAYGYHNIIPTISTYLKRSPRLLTRAIFWGTLFPLVVYSLWQTMVIGTLSQDLLIEALEAGTPISQLFDQTAGYSGVGNLTLFFSLFALVTSLLGVSMSMVDFLGDGVGILNRRGWRRVALCLAVFVPPLIFSYDNPKIFLKALEYAGGFGEAFLNCLLPVAMVWVGRYKMQLDSAYSLPGGKVSLALITLFTLMVVGVVCVGLA